MLPLIVQDRPLMMKEASTIEVLGIAEVADTVGVTSLAVGLLVKGYPYISCLRKHGPSSEYIILM